MYQDVTLKLIKIEELTEYLVDMDDSGLVIANNFVKAFDLLGILYNGFISDCFPTETGLW